MYGRCLHFATADGQWLMAGSLPILVHIRHEPSPLPYVNHWPLTIGLCYTPASNPRRNHGAGTREGSGHSTEASEKCSTGEEAGTRAARHGGKDQTEIVPRRLPALAPSLRPAPACSWFCRSATIEPMTELPVLPHQVTEAPH